jgi:hypothetical protein
MFKLYKHYAEGGIKGIIIGQFGKWRNLIDASYAIMDKGFNHEYGVNIIISKSSGLFLGLTIHRLQLFVFILNRAEDFVFDYDNDIPF